MMLVFGSGPKWGTVLGWFIIFFSVLETLLLFFTTCSFFEQHMPLSLLWVRFWCCVLYDICLISVKCKVAYFICHFVYNWYLWISMVTYFICHFVHKPLGLTACFSAPRSDFHMQRFRFKIRNPRCDDQVRKGVTF